MMVPSPSVHPIDPASLCGKLTTHDSDTYIVLCLHCLHSFRSLTDLLRHRLLNHNILDPIPVGEGLPRVSKDGSWLVAGGDSEPPCTVPPSPQGISPGYPGMQRPAGMPTPSPPPNIHVPQFKSLGPNHQMQNQYQGFNQPPQSQPNR